jgi:hypothetical protein
MVEWRKVFRTPNGRISLAVLTVMLIALVLIALGLAIIVIGHRTSGIFQVAVGAWAAYRVIKPPQLSRR